MGLEARDLEKERESEREKERKRERKGGRKEDSLYKVMITFCNQYAMYCTQAF